MSLRERFQGLLEGNAERSGSRFGALSIFVVLTLLLGWVGYATFLMPAYQKPPRPVQTAYTTGATREISLPAEEPPPPPPPPRQQAPQAQAPPPRATPPKPKGESDEARYRRMARLASHYAGPFDEAWRKLASTVTERAQEAETRPQQTLEVPPAQQERNGYQAGNGTGSVWKDDFYARGNGQPGVLQPPQSPYMVMRGSVIPVALLGGFDTQTPGQITAVVVQDIRDTRSGRYVLIPKGSVVIGGYDINLPYDQDRVPSAWDELRLPSGETMPLSSFPGADAEGKAGIPVDVNTHFWKTFGRSLLLTVSGATARMGLSQSYNGNDYDMGDALAQSGGRQLERRSRQMWDRGGYRGPTGTKEAGEVFLLQVTAPMTFPPGDYYERTGGGRYASHR